MISRQSLNRQLDKAVEAYQVYCDRGDVSKANVAKAKVIESVHELMAGTRERIAITKARMAKEVKEDVRPEAQRPPPVGGGTKKVSKGKSKGKSTTSKVSKASSKPAPEDS